ncbi:MAG: RNA polymerase-binding protein RbpA [Propionibacteriaceae bacterium]|nr:RNA polymerase-binding protein RbpA [Propionibacteriaceae bacterium]
MSKKTTSPGCPTPSGHTLAPRSQGAAGKAEEAAPKRTVAAAKTPRPDPDASGRRLSEQTDALAGRQKIRFRCERGHEFTLIFAEDADLPTQWDCPRCGQAANRADGTPPATRPSKPPLSHWDRLLQRRSLSELETLLAERIREMRSESQQSAASA